MFVIDASVVLSLVSRRRVERDGRGGRRPTDGRGWDRTGPTWPIEIAQRAPVCRAPRSARRGIDRPSSATTHALPIEIVPVEFSTALSVIDAAQTARSQRLRRVLSRRSPTSEASDSRLLTPASPRPVGWPDPA